MKLQIQLQPEFLDDLAEMTGNVMGIKVDGGALESSDQWYFNPKVPVFLAHVNLNNRVQCVMKGLAGVAFSPVMIQYIVRHIGTPLPKMAEILMLRFSRSLSQSLQLIVNFHLLPPIEGGKLNTEGYSLTMPVDECGNVQWLFFEGFLPPDIPPQVQVMEMIR